MDLAFQKIKSVNDKLTLFLFKEEALVYSESDNKLHLLNALGIFIWLLLEEGNSKEQIVQNYVDNGGQEKSELEPLIDQLQALINNARLDNSTNDDEELWLKEIKLDYSPTDPLTNGQAYRILDVAFYFDLPDEEVKNLILPLLQQFRASCDDESIIARIYVQVSLDQNKKYRININGYLFSWQISHEKLTSFLLDRLRKVAFSFSEYYLAAHAAIVSKNNTCLMMPAVSYSGKSTLSAALISSGYQYFSDEMGILDKCFYARPVPLGLGLKSGSWEVLNEFLPQLAKQDATQRWDGVAIKYLAVPYGNINTGDELANQRQKVSHIVFPKYVTESETKLLPLSIPQIIYQLYQAGFTSAGPLSLDLLGSLLDWLNATPGYQLIFDDLHEAVVCLNENLQ